MSDLYKIRQQKTFRGQTAGGILRTAKICEMQCGDYNIFVTDKNGREYQAIMTDSGNLLLADYGVAVALLITSNTAACTLQKLEKECADLMLKDDPSLEQYL